MSKNQQDKQITTTTTQPSSVSPSRKVSINVNESYHGHDNPAFESRSRKVSAASDHAEIGPVRKKSILHNAQAYTNYIENSPPSELHNHQNGILFLYFLCNTVVVINMNVTGRQIEKIQNIF